MTGLLGMFAKAPKKQSEIVFLDGIVCEVRLYEPVAHGVTGGVTFSKQEVHYLLVEATIGGAKSKRLTSNDLNLPSDVKEILDAKTLDEVTAVLGKYHKEDQYKIVEN